MTSHAFHFRRGGPLRAGALAAVTVCLLAACNEVADDDVGDATTPDQPVATAVIDPVGSPSVAPGEPVEAAIWGTWDVTSARLTDPSGPVQAYGDSELAALGDLELTIAEDQVRWSGAPLHGVLAEYSSFDFECANPRPEATDSNGLVLHCTGGSEFGPPSAGGNSALELTGNDALTLVWFDGVTLELRRAP